MQLARILCYRANSSRAFPGINASCTPFTARLNENIFLNIFRSIQQGRNYEELVVRQYSQWRSGQYDALQYHLDGQS